MDTRSVARSAAVACLLVAALAGLATPAAADGIDVENTFEGTNDDGTVDVKTGLDVPTGTTSLEVTVPEGAEVYETQGFSQSPGEERTYEWTRSTNQPYLRYHWEGNVTIDRGDGPRHVYAVTDSWALVRTPNVNLRWSGTSAEVNRTNRIDGEGVAGRHITYLGHHEEHTREAPDQRFRLVVPEAADMAASPRDVLDLYEATSERLRIGERDPEVLVVVAPTDGIEWAATGVQRGDADLWVRDAERLDTPVNTWIHEYVHTLQDYEPTEETRWTLEAMADYYAALLPYEDGRIDYEAFRDKMADGTADRYADVRLVDPDTWTDAAQYEKGALVFGHLDRRLRAETDGSMDAVVEAFNDPDAELTHEEFLDLVESTGNADVRADAERYTETTETPPVWSREEHVAAFGGPDFRYGFDGFAVEGPYREGSLDDPRLVTGERLVATVLVENVGTQGGEFVAELRVDGEVVASESGELDAGAATTVDLAHAFDATGSYDLDVVTDRATVTVEEPAAIEVQNLSVEPVSPAMGETVALRATVAATADRPAAGEVTFTVEGDPLETVEVRTDAGETVVETTTTFDAPGEHRVEAGGQAATVTVRDETVTPGTPTPDPSSPGNGTGSTPTPADGAGFGALVAVLVLAAALAVLLVIGRR